MLMEYFISVATGILRRDKHILQSYDSDWLDMYVGRLRYEAKQ